MQIKKKNGKIQDFSPDKIMKRIKDQSQDLNVDPSEVFKKCIAGVVDGMSTKDIDALVANTAAEMILIDPDYSYLASRILITRHAKIIGVKPELTDFLFDYKVLADMAPTPF